jgi:hypothetical protein
MSIKITVESLRDGGAVEILNAEIHKVLENIVDPNTPAKKPRKVKLEMTFHPNEQRDISEIEIKASHTPQPPMPLTTSIIIDKDKHGNAVARERMTGESKGSVALPGMHPDSGTITTLNSKAKEA